MSSEAAFSCPTMERRRCGRSGLELPALGMGCWAYGGGDYWGPQTQQEVDTVVHQAIERGCNFFDTAEAYNQGASELSLGQAIKGIARDRVIIATKISPSNTEPKQLAEHCEASLRRLQTDYIDIYMVHWPITPHSIRHFTTENLMTPSVSAAFETLMRLKQSGKIRHIGVSNFGRAKLEEALSTGADIVINELPYSLLTRAIELEILPFCRARGIGVLGYMSLMQGVLSDSYSSFAELPAMRRRTRHFDGRNSSLCRHGLSGAEVQTQSAVREIRSIAQNHGLTTAEISLQWALAGVGITSSLCGSRNLRQLEMNIRAASAPLATAVVEELNRATQPVLQALGPSFDYFESPENDRTK